MSSITQQEKLEEKMQKLSITVRFMRPKGEVISAPDNLLELCEYAGRTCYQSRDRITDDSSGAFLKKYAIGKGHESMLEHGNVTLRIISDRCLTHQLVRHRLAAYSQESQRYCRYNEEVTFIIPEAISFPKYWEGKDITVSFVGGTDFDDLMNDLQDPKFLPALVWVKSCVESIYAYNRLFELTGKAEVARTVLAPSASTEIIATYNLRQMRHIFKMRLDKHAQSDIRRVMKDIFTVLYEKYPPVFEDLKERFFPFGIYDEKPDWWNDIPGVPE